MNKRQSQNTKAVFTVPSKEAISKVSKNVSVKSRRLKEWTKMVVVVMIIVVSHPPLKTFFPSDTLSSQESFTMTNSTSQPSALQDWWQPYVDAASVIYQSSNQTQWCRQTTKSKHRHRSKIDHRTGMYLVKVEKTGSSTAAAAALQIAESVALKNGLAKPCPTHVNHGFDYEYRQDPSFLWTVVRQPHKRSISEYFFKHISRRGMKYNSSHLIRFLLLKKNYQLEYISKGMKSNPLLVNILKKKSSNTSQLMSQQLQTLETVISIFQTYDFIAVSERMDESLVVLKLLHGFPDESIVVFSSKINGGYDDGVSRRTCYKIQKSYTTEDVDLYLAEHYREGNLDFLLYDVANRSLDKTIEFLGRERVEKEVKRHRKLHQLAEDLCLEKAVFPCSKHLGAPNRKSKRSCFWGDVGCGHKCVMNAIRNTNKYERNV